jgi:hypothetical protein
MRLLRASCLLVSVTAMAAGGLSTSPAVNAAEASSYAVSTTTLPDGSTTTVRWDPCGDRITFKVNVGGLARADRSAAVREAKKKVRQLAKASGLRFSYRGKTSFVPRSDNAASQPAELVVGYVRAEQTDYPLAGPAAGYGGYNFGWQGRADGSISYGVTSAYVVIDVADTRTWSTSLTRGGVTRPGLLGHELGHAVGLMHVADRHQVMYASLHSGSPRTYADGDRTGLDQVGRAAGCLRPVTS